MTVAHREWSDAVGVVMVTDDGTLRYRVTHCCGARPRQVYLPGEVGDQPAVVCGGCGLVLADAAADPVPQPPGAPCTCVPMPPGFPVVPGRATCGQHGDHLDPWTKEQLS